MNRDLNIGYRLYVPEMNGRYFTIKKKIGSGASSVTYLAELNKTEHILKECNPYGLMMHREDDGKLVPDTKLNEKKFAECLERFQKCVENQLLFRITDDLKNVTSNIQGVYHANGTMYIDMTYFRGNTYDNISDTSLLELFRRMTALTQVIAKYHEKGFLYLDIKPQNIYTIPETPDLIMMFDFDSVLPETVAKTTSSVSYTEEWAAPEQKMAKYQKDISKATDLYAIGEIIFYKVMNQHSKADDRFDFSQFEFDLNNPFFEDVNPKVFPLLCELFHNTLSYSPYKRYETADELLSQLTKIMNLLANSEKPYLVSTTITPNNLFIGRESELYDIHKELQKNSRVFLCGIGGIGKSELAKNYAVRYKESYDTVLFATYSGRWIRLINDDSSIHIAHVTSDLGNSEQEYFKTKIKTLLALCDERTLFIIDNLDEDEFEGLEQERWENIRNLKCKFIFTSKMIDWSNYGKVISVSAIKCQQSLELLFDNYCPIKENQLDDVREIIDYIGGHTLILEMLAKLAQNSHATPAEILSRLKAYGISRIGKEDVTLDKDNTRTRKDVFSQICAVLNMSNFSPEQRYIIANIALLPANGIKAKLLKQLCCLKDYNAVKQLVDSSWLTWDQVNEKYKINSVVADVAISSCLVDASDQCIVMLNNIEELILNCVHVNENANYYSNEIAEYVSIYNSVAKSLAKFNIGSVNIASFYNIAPDLLMKYGYLQEAIQYCENAVKIYIRASGRVNVNTAVSINNLGYLYKEMGNFEDAKEKYQEAYFIWRKLYGKNNNYVATSLNNLGGLYFQNGKLKLALKNCKKALRICRCIYKENNFEVISSFNNVGVIYKNLGKLNRALKYCLKAYEASSILPDVDISFVSTLLNNIGVIYKRQKKFVKAEACFINAYDKMYAAYRDENADIAMPLINLGELYAELENFKDAEIKYQEAYTILKKKYKEKHINIAYLLENMGDLYIKMNDSVKAQECYINASRIQQQIFGSNYTEDSDLQDKLNSIHL